MHNGAFYREKCIDWCQNNLDKCEIKEYPYGYYIYSPNAEILPISFYDEPFLSYEPILNDPKLP